MQTSHVRTKATPATRSYNEAVELEFRVSKTVLVIIAILSAIIGIWGLACLTAGCIMSSDFLELGSNWFKAIQGL